MNEESRANELRSFSIWPLLPIFGWSLWLFHPLLQAHFGLIDDHELVLWFGHDGQLSLGGAWKILRESEIFNPQSTARFRPIYYGSRILEAWFWGASPHLWYLGRIFVHAVLIFSIFRFLSALFPFRTLIGVFAFYCSLDYFWIDIVCRLGPAELYAAAFLATMLFGLTSLIDNRSDLGCVAIAVGFGLISGTKENMIFLAAVPALVIFWRWKSLSRTAVAALGFSIVFGMAMFIRALVVVSGGGEDVYGREVSGNKVAHLATALFAEYPLYALGEVFAGVILAACFLIRRFRPTLVQPRHLQLISRLSLLFLGMGYVAVSQYVFYQGDWPNQSNSIRYDFPGVLIIQALGFIAFCLVLKFSLVIRYERVLMGFVLSVASLFLVATSWASIETLRVAAFKVARTTQRTSAALDEINKYLSIDPSRRIVITVNSMFDYEPMFAIRSLLLAAGIKNPIAVEIVGFSSSNWKAQDLAHSLVLQMEAIRDKGGQGFIPRSEITNETGCLSIGLSGPPGKDCTDGVLVPY